MKATRQHNIVTCTETDDLELTSSVTAPQKLV